jgi:hypothetical protein
LNTFVVVDDPQIQQTLKEYTFLRMRIASGGGTFYRCEGANEVTAQINKPAGEVTFKCNTAVNEDDLICAHRI